MKKLILYIVLLLPLITVAQKPDYASFDKDTQGYDSLMNRYLKADSTLTLNNYKTLYYGFTASHLYQPFKTIIPLKEMVVFQRKKLPTPEDYRALIKAINRTLPLDPFNLGNLNLLSFAYTLLSDKEQAFTNQRRVAMIMQTILSSGSGLDEKDPYYIIYRSQGEDVMNYLNKKFRTPIVISIDCEYYPLLERDANAKGYYFDFGVIYTRQPDASDIKKGGWEFNGMKIK